MKSYRTVKGTAEAVYEIQKSRFLTHVSHAGSEEEARAFIQARKKEFFDARHNCSAYVLGADGAKQKSNDDGEPGGTAGNPMLEAVKQKGLTDVVVVVTRYFGGIKLGAGGLIRAYSHSAVLGLDAATIVEMVPFSVVQLHLDYSLLASVEHYLRQNGVRTGETVYAEAVMIPLLLKPEQKGAICEGITDITAGRARLEEAGERMLAVPVEDRSGKTP